MKKQNYNIPSIEVINVRFQGTLMDSYDPADHHKPGWNAPKKRKPF